MASWHRKIILPFAFLQVIWNTLGCSLYRDVKDLVHSAKEKIEEKPTEQKGGAKEQEQPHQGPLLDNKVTALRIQDALNQAGTEFQKVEVKADAQGVVLTGTVPSAALRTRAEEIAQSVHRSVRLKNELQVAQ